VTRPTLELVVGGNAREGAPPGLSLASLYEAYVGAVLARCQYLLRNTAEAEDATQEVFMRALAAADGFRGDASALTWLITIATRHCLNLLRSKRAGWHEKVQRSALVSVVSADPVEDRDVIRETLRQFDEETQLAAMLYHVDEMTLDEVAAAIERSVPTVRKRLAEFAAAARIHLKQQGGAP
jgi:RNA polymerase sigma-70 factor (ECF subfamily)